VEAYTQTASYMYSFSKYFRSAKTIFKFTIPTPCFYFPKADTYTADLSEINRPIYINLANITWSTVLHNTRDNLSSEVILYGVGNRDSISARVQVYTLSSMSRPTQNPASYPVDTGNSFRDGKQNEA
jgi:hypothetical protein